MEYFVFDTNVAVVANRQSPQASRDCISACSEAIEYLKESGILLIDDGWRILKEYSANLSSPGVGFSFYKWVLSNKSNIERCRQISLHARNQPADNFEEFPNDPALSNFDRSDRKFVAVALASGNSPEILNAVDRDWWDHRHALAKNGVRIKFLCPRQFSP
jgi:hypothetical protein